MRSAPRLTRSTCGTQAIVPAAATTVSAAIARFSISVSTIDASRSRTRSSAGRRSSSRIASWPSVVDSM
jgi:hypothetical protein